MSNAHTQSVHSAARNIVVFVLALSILFTALGYFFFVDYAQEDDTYQLLALAGGIVLSLLIAYQSSYGRQLWNFMREARVELRKIVWPTRHNALVNSGLVFLLVLIAGIYFWVLDTFFRWAVWSLLGFE